MRRKTVYLLISVFMHQLGDILFDFSIIWTVTSISGNISDAALMIGGSMLFRAFIAMFTGIVVDSGNKKRVIFLANALAICIVASYGIFTQTIVSNISLAILIILLNNINNGLFGMSTLILASSVLKTDEFIKYQSFVGIMGRILVVAGNAMAGVMVIYIPLTAAIFIIILSFAFSSFIAFLVPYEDSKENKSVPIPFKSRLSVLLDSTIVSLKSIYKIRFLRAFIAIMLILNFAYGFIPYVLPLAISSSANNPLILSILKISIAVGEVVGLLIVSRLGHYVSKSFLFGLLGCAVSMLLLPFSHSIIVLIAFLLYGICDSLTQPLFSYTVTLIEGENRAKTLAGIDTIIMLSPIIGVWLGTMLYNYSKVLCFIYLAVIFIVPLFIIRATPSFRKIVVVSEKDSNK